MIDDKPIKVFISYSHETNDHKDKVRSLADELRIKYGLDVSGDFYEEDNPTGGQLPDLMEQIRFCDRVICILTPVYKNKANEAKGGVGYEKTIITSQLYEDIGSSKFIPVIIDETLDFNDCIPDFLTITRKAILRSTFNSNDSFVKEIARVIHKRPEKPKPPLGKNILDEEPQLEISIDQIDFTTIVKSESYPIIFETALFYAKKNDEHNYRALVKKVKKQVIQQLLATQDKYAMSVTENNSQEITEEFVEAAAPLFLVAFAGYLSFNQKFSKQEGLLIDLLSIDGWKESRQTKFIHSIPELLGYVYHHLYGALQIDNDDLSGIPEIFEQKIPVNSSRYDYLYKVKSVTGWVESLGRDCFKSFEYLLKSYEKWPWLKLLFDDYSDYRKALLTYQVMINLLDYLQLIKADVLFENNDQLSYCNIPPSAGVGSRQEKEHAINYLIKHGRFFKGYIKQHLISKDKIKDNWKLWLREISKFNTMGIGHIYIYENNFIEALLD